jgi:hypothetical protein
MPGNGWIVTLVLVLLVAATPGGLSQTESAAPSASEVAYCTLVTIHEPFDGSSYTVETLPREQCPGRGGQDAEPEPSTQPAPATGTPSDDEWEGCMEYTLDGPETRGVALTVRLASPGATC